MIFVRTRQGWILAYGEAFLQAYACEQTSALQKWTNQIPMQSIERQTEHASPTTNKKPNAFALGRLWWGMLDSDQRSRRQQIYSLPPLAAREIPPIKLQDMELVNGVEPSTCWLQISCSAIEPHQHICPATHLILSHKKQFVNRKFKIFKIFK